MGEVELSCGLPPGPDFADLAVFAEELAPARERHLLTFEGHVTHLPDRDRGLLEHVDVKTMVGEPDRIHRHLARLGDVGFQEIVYTPTGPDVTRELEAFASAARAATRRARGT